MTSISFHSFYSIFFDRLWLFLSFAFLTSISFRSCSCAALWLRIQLSSMKFHHNDYNFGSRFIVTQCSNQSIQHSECSIQTTQCESVGLESPPICTSCFIFSIMLSIAHPALQISLMLLWQHPLPNEASEFSAMRYLTTIVHRHRTHCTFNFINCWVIGCTSRQWNYVITISGFEHSNHYQFFGKPFQWMILTTIFCSTITAGQRISFHLNVPNSWAQWSVIKHLWRIKYDITECHKEFSKSIFASTEEWPCNCIGDIALKGVTEGMIFPTWKSWSLIAFKVAVSSIDTSLLLVLALILVDRHFITNWDFGFIIFSKKINTVINFFEPNHPFKVIPCMHSPSAGQHGSSFSRKESAFHA